MLNFTVLPEIVARRKGLGTVSAFVRRLTRVHRSDMVFQGDVPTELPLTERTRVRLEGTVPVKYMAAHMIDPLARVRTVVAVDEVVLLRELLVR